MGGCFVTRSNASSADGVGVDPRQVADRATGILDCMATTNASLIWNIANLLRGPYQPNRYGDVILPLTILRRLDAILAPEKDAVLAEYHRARGLGIDPYAALSAKFGLPFFNTSAWDFGKLTADPAGLADNLADYVAGFSPNIRDVFAGYGLPKLI